MARADNRHLWQSPGGAVYLRLAIPPELRDRPEFRTSNGKPKINLTLPLGVRDLIEARPLRDQQIAYWQRTFAKMAAGVALDAQDIAAEAERIRLETLATLRAPPTEVQTLALKVAREEGKLEAQRAFRDALRSTLNDIEAGVASVAERHGIAIEKGTPLYAEVANALLRAINAAESEVDADSVSARAETPRSASARKPEATSNGERFSQAFEHYAAWLRSNRKLRRKSIHDYTTRARRFIEFAKDPNLDEVTIDIAQAFLDDIAKTTSAATVNLHHVVCKAVFEHARTERHKFDGHNPFSFRQRKHTAQSKSKYTVAELNRFFASDAFLGRQIKPGDYGVNSALPWMTAIGLFSGLALEEAGQLRPQDVRKEADTLIIAVERAAAVSGELKRAARERTVPLHPALVKLGLLEYIAALPKGTPWLFPNLGEGAATDKRAGPVGKAFNKWRRRLGIERPPEKLDFHSLRHTFGKAIEDAGISPNDCARLLGHAVKGISASVYSAPELKRVAPLVAKVGWEGLRLPD
jgi:integrase